MSPPDPSPRPSDRPVRVLHFADLENVYDHPGRVARLSGLLSALRDDRTLVVGAGDDTALGVLSLLTEDGPAGARPFFDRVAHDVDTFGNHDLDFGAEWAREWAASVPTTYLCANIEGAGADGVADAAVFERAGRRVGVVGLAHPETEDISGADIGFSVLDPVAAAESAVADLPETDHLVVASHCGRHDDRIAAALEADLVVGGHVHERRTDRVDGTLLVRTAGNGTELSETVLDGEPSVTYHPVDGRTGTRIEGTDRDVAKASSGRGVGDDVPVDEVLAAEYRRRRAAAGVDEVVATVEEPLARTEAERFRSESRLGNFAADAFRAAADADVGVFPAGSLRGGPPLSGEVTVADVVGCCPFGGDVVELELHGADLRAELAAMAEPRPERGWVHCHLSGLRVVWTHADELRSVRVLAGEPPGPGGEEDSSATREDESAAGNRGTGTASDGPQDDRQQGDGPAGDRPPGEPLVDDATYSVATAEYVAVVSAFGRFDVADVVARHGPQYEALLDHARAGGLAVGLSGRIRRVPADSTAPDAGADG